MSTIASLSQVDLDSSRGPLHPAHPAGYLKLLLLPPLYCPGGGSCLLSSSPPLLPPSLLPPPSVFLLPLIPHSAATWHCARPSTRPKCAGSWTVPLALPPNRPPTPPEQCKLSHSIRDWHRLSQSIQDCNITSHAVTGCQRASHTVT